MRRERLEIGWYAVRPFFVYIVLFITVRSILLRLLESVLIAMSADMTVSAGDHDHPGKERRRMDQAPKGPPPVNGTSPCRYDQSVRLFQSASGRTRRSRHSLTESIHSPFCGCCLWFSHTVCGGACLQRDCLAPIKKRFLPSGGGVLVLPCIWRRTRQSPAGPLRLCDGNGLRNEF